MPIKLVEMLVIKIALFCAGHGNKNAIFPSTNMKKFPKKRSHKSLGGRQETKDMTIKISWEYHQLG